MTTDPLDTLAHALQPCWDMAKTSPDYLETPWIEFHTELVKVTTALGKVRTELAQYHQVRTMIQDLILEYAENVPQGVR